MKNSFVAKSPSDPANGLGFLTKDAAEAHVGVMNNLLENFDETKWNTVSVDCRGNMKFLNLDLDGVFADFERTFNEIVGFSYHENPKLAWSKLEKIDNLFLTLKPINGSIEFFEEINERAVVPIRILTALPLLTDKLITAPNDKRAWVAYYLCPNLQVICSDGWDDKKNYCNSGDVLVDDMARNIEDWKSVGGVGIHHEGHYSQAQERTIFELKKVGAIK